MHLFLLSYILIFLLLLLCKLSFQFLDFHLIKSLLHLNFILGFVIVLVILLYEFYPSLGSRSQYIIKFINFLLFHFWIKEHIYLTIIIYYCFIVIIVIIKFAIINFIICFFVNYFYLNYLLFDFNFFAHEHY